MSHKPTDEQQAIIDAAVAGDRNLLVNALAGAAKSTTLEMISNAVKGRTMLFLAFNVKIKNTLEAKIKEGKMPSFCVAKTLNGLGHGIWAKATNKRLSLDADKVNNFFKESVNDLKGSSKDEAWDNYGDLLRAFKTARNAGWIPDRTFPNGRGLVDDESAFNIIGSSLNDEDLATRYFRLLRDLQVRTIRTAFEGLIDFDDQIFMPAIFGGPFPRFALNLVDEAQDLSPLNHEMLRRLVAPTAKVIAVGDPWQSIYGFRGAVSNGMRVLRDSFDMAEFTLSISFRCPRSVVERARSRVPHMRYPEWAIDGEVKQHGTWGPDTIPDNCAIICRNNAPLFSLGFALIRAGRGVKLHGSDIGPGLVKTLRKLGPGTLNREQSAAALEEWYRGAYAKAKNKSLVVEKRECLEIFLEQGDTLSAAIAYAEHLFSSAGPIDLLSGHKSKGLEWDVTFHLDPWRVPRRDAEGEELEQELNVKYVIETRAKRELHLIDMQGYSAEH